MTLCIILLTNTWELVTVAVVHMIMGMGHQRCWQRSCFERPATCLLTFWGFGTLHVRFLRVLSVSSPRVASCLGTTESNNLHRNSGETWANLQVLRLRECQQDRFYCWLLTARRFGPLQSKPTNELPKTQARKKIEREKRKEKKRERKKKEKEKGKDSKETKEHILSKTELAD